MAIKREVAYGIVQGISDLWQDEELRDLTVEVGHTKFSCHRFLLGACSGFFRGLFRSGMKEIETQIVTLQNISSDTFKLVLEALYTGHGVLTDDNVIDIWHAVNQLQIKFMIQECENFVIRNLSLENYEEIFHTAKLLSPSFVLENVLRFINKHYENFTKTDTFLEFSFEEINLLISGQYLVVKSEDIVLESIFRWVEFREKKISKIINESVSKEMMDCGRDLKSQTGVVQDQLQSGRDKTKSGLSDKTDRREIVVNLLSAARTCLATTTCLEKMMDQKIITERREAREIITKALLYKLQLDKRHGQWPSAAVHRDDSKMDHIAVVPVVQLQVQRKTLSAIRVYSFSRKNWYKINQPNISANVKDIQFTVYENALYLFYVSNPYLYFSHHLNGSWTTDNLPIPTQESNICLVTMDLYIYILKYETKQLIRFDTTSKEINELKPLPDKTVIEHATKFERKILIFYSNTSDAVDETVIHCYDTEAEEWTRVNNLQGPAKKLTTFKDDHHTYVLQTDGDVWKVVKPQTDVVDFEYVTKLWGCNWTVHGAVTHLGTLYIYGDQSTDHTNDVQVKNSVPGVFAKIVYIESDLNGCKAFIPATVTKGSLINLS